MKTPFALAALLLAAGLARADLVIVEKVDAVGHPMQMTIKVSGDEVRMDMSSEVSAIINGTTGDTTVLMHAQKSYMLISGSVSKAMVKKMAGMLQQSGSGGASASPAPVKATGRTEKINGYNATEYTFGNSMLTASYWMSSDFPNAKAVTEALAKVRKDGSIFDPSSQLAPDLSALPGVPIRTEEQIALNGQKVVADLVSATVQTVDPADFQPPADYTKMDTPPMPGMEASASQSDDQAQKDLAAKLKNPLDLHFTAVDGAAVDISKMRGKVVLVDFWATWCGPCRDEVPNVISTYKKLHDKGFEIVGISLDQDKDSLDSFIKENGMTWPQYFDGKGWDNAISSTYSIGSIPTMWLVNKKGYVVSTDGGDDLESQVEKLLSE